MAAFLVAGLALTLSGGVSATPFPSQGQNVTSPGRYNNHTSTTTVQSTTTLFDTVIVAPSASIAGPVAVQPSIPVAANYHVSPSSGAAAFGQSSSPAASGPVSSPPAQGAFQVAAVSQPASQASFQTIVVTETLAGCTLGGSAAATLLPATSVSGQAPFAVAASSAPSASYAASTLLPAVHWEYPVDDIRNLIPSNSSDLYYSAGGVSDPSVQHLFASLSTTLSYDAVVLDHSSYVASTTCSDSGIVVTFTSTEAFNLACDSWSSVSSGFVLVTYTDGCHGDSDEQRTFWLVESLNFSNGTLSIQAVVQEEIATEDAISGVDMTWGTYYPGNSTSSTSSGSGTGSSSSGSGSASGTDGTGSSSTSSSSGSGSSNSNSTTNGSSCGAAPSSVIDGLPAIDCGDATFDTDLDNLIGYLDFSSGDYSSSVEDFLPGVSLDADDLQDDDPELSRRDAHIRKRSFGSWLKSAVSVVVHVATAPVRLATAAVTHLPIVGDFITKASEFDPAINGQQTFQFGPDASADSPWGKAAQIYSKSKTSSTDSSNTADVAIYCVDCGVKGKVALAGQAKWNLRDGLHALSAAINANLETGINLGLVANAAYTDSKTKKIINAPLPEVGVSVAKLFTAGVYVSVDAVSTVTVSAEGQVLVGVVMTIPNFQANLNLFDTDGAGKSGVTGFTPTFTKRFEASGKVDASLRLSLPVAINVGIEVPPLNLKRVLALIEEPSIYGNLTVAASTNNVAPASDTCNNGIEYFANLQNDIKFDFLGLKTFTLNHYDSPALLQGCKQFGSSATSAGTTTTDASATTTDPSATTTDPAATTTDSDGNTTDAATTTTDATTGATNAAATTTDSAATTTDAEGGATDSTATATTTDAGADATDAATTTTNAAAGSTDTAGSTNDAGNESVERRSYIWRRQDNSTSDNTVASGDTVIADDSEDSFGSDSSDTADQSDDPVGDDSSDADNSEFSSDTNEALAAADQETTDDGLTYTTVLDFHKTFALAPGENGNLYAAAYSEGDDNGTALFAQYENIIVGDDGDRILHYYPDEMAVYNASRIRLSYEDQIPKTADIITLSPIDYDSSDSSNPNIYFAVDSKSNVYDLVLCDFTNGADSKVFIVNDQSGIDALTTNVNTRYTVTGAPVSSCYSLALITGMSSNSTTSS